jgi:hypothetical protein
VVAGHWLVTGLVPGPEGVTTASPLTAMPGAAPATWLLQTLGLLFFAGGYSAACSARAPQPAIRWARAQQPEARSAHAHPPAACWASALRSAAGQSAGRSRGAVARLLRPATFLLAGWALVLFTGAALGTPTATLRTIAGLVVSPLWFLLPFLALRAATGPLLRVLRRFRAAALLLPVAAVAAGDLGLLPDLAVIPAAWSIPWLLGMILAGTDRRRTPISTDPTDDASPPRADPQDDATRLEAGARDDIPRLQAGARDDIPRLQAGARDDIPRLQAGARDEVPRLGAGPWVGAALACNGAAALAALILIAGYPASAVGVPGAGRSNLDPPTLAAVALAVTQIGVFLMLRGPLARLLRHDRLRRPVAALNRVAVPVYLGHQSVLLVVAGAAALVNPAMPGLLTAPDGVAWAWQRLVWLPVLGGVLAVVTRGRRHGEPDYLKPGLRGTLFDGSRARTTSGGDRCAR